MAKSLEKVAEKIVPFRELQTRWGKNIKFYEARTLWLAFNMYGISETANTRSIAISESIDASQVTKNLQVITAGFKMGVIEAINPITGKALCIDGIYENVQSRDHGFLSS